MIFDRRQLHGSGARPVRAVAFGVSALMALGASAAANSTVSSAANSTASFNEQPRKPLEDFGQRETDAESDRWTLPSAPWNWLDAQSRETERLAPIHWSPTEPLGLFSSHAIGEDVRLEARAGLVPVVDAWASVLARDSSTDAALLKAEASLAIVAEFGSRRSSPWQLAFGGGWTQSDQDFSSALDADPAQHANPFGGGNFGGGNASDGEAVVWLRLSRRF
jgi:hypothetical protein